jgi:hypothetical protein
MNVNATRLGTAAQDRQLRDAGLAGDPTDRQRVALVDNLRTRCTDLPARTDVSELVSGGSAWC